ncbi:MAG: protease inhibitor I42 family protein [Candidatus Margulisbacteria bacterium]|nr:protease inhibitor I42 family protein [Candidatus Margulisiibacteriota bacterium]
MKNKIILFLLLAVLLAGCRDGGKAGGPTMQVEKGKPFKLELEANPTTGYNWYITEMDESFFRVLDSGYQAKATGRVGTGGTSYWKILPLKNGSSKIRLLYFRPWEGKDKAVEEYRIRAVIR